MIALGALLSMLGVNSGIAVTGPRSLYVLSQDGFLPRMLSGIHLRFRTPYAAVVANCVITLLLATCAGSLSKLIKVSVLASLWQYIPTCIAVIIMRRARPEGERAFRAPGGDMLPAAGLLVCILLLVQAKPDEILFSLGTIIIGLPFYFVSRRSKRSPVS